VRVLSRSYAPMLTWAAHRWFIALFFVIPIWGKLLFLLDHRALRALTRARCTIATSTSGNG
jgi:hypothetical protein